MTNPLRQLPFDLRNMNPLSSAGDVPTLQDDDILFVQRVSGPQEGLGFWSLTKAELAAQLGGAAAAYVNLVDSGFDGFLDYSGDTALRQISFGSNSFSSASFAGCSNLELVDGANSAALESLDMTGTPKLRSFNVGGQLSQLNLSGHALLTSFAYSEVATPLLALDLSSCVALTSYQLTGGASLQSLNFAGCASLTTLNITGISGDLTYFNIAGCTGLTDLDTHNMPITTITGLDTLSALTSWVLAGSNVNMTDLQAALPDVPTLQFLEVQNFAGTALDLSVISSLNEIFLIGAAGFDTLTLGSQPLLNALTCGTLGLAALDISGCPLLHTVVLEGCQLTQSGVNAILVALDTHGLSGGTVNLSGGGSAVPNGAGAAAKTALEGKGWTVQTN